MTAPAFKYQAGSMNGLSCETLYRPIVQSHMRQAGLEFLLQQATCSTATWGPHFQKLTCNALDRLTQAQSYCQQSLCCPVAQPLSRLPALQHISENASTYYGRHQHLVGLTVLFACKLFKNKPRCSLACIGLKSIQREDQSL